jgi:hypothetical protein
VIDKRAVQCGAHIIGNRAAEIDSAHLDPGMFA